MLPTLLFTALLSVTAQASVLKRAGEAYSRLPVGGAQYSRATPVAPIATAPWPSTAESDLPSSAPLGASSSIPFTGSAPLPTGASSGGVIPPYSTYSAPFPSSNISTAATASSKTRTKCSSSLLTSTKTKKPCTSSLAGASSAPTAPVASASTVSGAVPVDTGLATYSVISITSAPSSSTTSYGATIYTSYPSVSIFPMASLSNGLPVPTSEVESVPNYLTTPVASASTKTKKPCSSILPSPSTIHGSSLPVTAPIATGASSSGVMPPYPTMGAPYPYLNSTSIATLATKTRSKCSSLLPTGSVPGPTGSATETFSTTNLASASSMVSSIVPSVSAPVVSVPASVSSMASMPPTIVTKVSKTPCSSTLLPSATTGYIA